MKLLMVLFFAAISGLVTLGVCPSLRRDVQAALVDAELLPAGGVAAKASARLPASSKTTLHTVGPDERERAAKAVAGDRVPSEVGPQATVAAQPPAARAEPAA
jgi:hypothetical protein